MRWSPILVLIPLMSMAAPQQPPPARLAYKNPLDVTVDEKGQTARVVLTGTRTIAVVDLATGKIKEERKWPKNQRIPLPTDVPFRHLKEGRQALTEEEAYERKTAFRLGGSAGRKDMEVHLMRFAKSNLPASQISQGWVFTSSLASRSDGIDSKKFWASLDEPLRGFADPADVDISLEGKQVFLLSAGSDQLIVADFERALAQQMLKNDHESHYPAFDLSVSRRIVLARLPTQSNPRRLGLSGDGKTLVVSNYLSDSLTVIDTEKLKVVKHIPLGGPALDAARRGEILFNSARLTQFGQFTCASCHPNGGADGLNWDLPRDGIGNFKNTKSLLGVKDTAPYGWLGTSPTLADRVAGTLRTPHRYEPSEEEVGDIVAYLETLAAPAKPQAAAKDHPAIGRGQALFEGKARCAVCHSGPTFDDGKIHDVGTGTIPGEDRFNTPSLRGLASSAPYLHDGRAATLEEVFSKYNEKKKHGDADRLTEGELADLVAYLRSL